MKTLKYKIDNYLEQGQRIKEEFPNIESIEYIIKDAGYLETKEIADTIKQQVSLSNGKGLILVSNGVARVFVYTKPLIVSEPVIVEE